MRIVYCRCCALLHIVADSTTVMLVPLLDYSTLYILLAVSLAMATCCTAKPRASSMVQLASSEYQREPWIFVHVSVTATVRVPGLVTDVSYGRYGLAS